MFIGTMPLPPFTEEGHRFALVLSGMSAAAASRLNERAESLKDATGAHTVLIFEDRVHVSSPDDDVLGVE
jgi:hypothetical protein